MTRFFDLDDGSIIEVRSNNAQRWRSNTCQCVLVFETNTLELDFAINVCRLHNAIADVTLVQDVLNHNKLINSTLGTGTILDRPQKEQLAKDREAEFKRIQTLGRPETRADKNNRLQIEADLRTKGR